MHKLVQQCTVRTTPIRDTGRVHRCTSHFRTAVFIKTVGRCHCMKCVRRKTKGCGWLGFHVTQEASIQLSIAMNESRQPAFLLIFIFNCIVNTQTRTLAALLSHRQKLLRVLPAARRSWHFQQNSDAYAAPTIALPSVTTDVAKSITDWKAKDYNSSLCHLYANVRAPQDKFSWYLKWKKDVSTISDRNKCANCYFISFMCLKVHSTHAKVWLLFCW